MTASINAIPENFRTFESTQQKEIKRTSVLGQEDVFKIAHHPTTTPRSNETYGKR